MRMGNCFSATWYPILYKNIYTEGKGGEKDAIYLEQWIMEQDNNGFVINWWYPYFFIVWHTVDVKLV